MTVQTTEVFIPKRERMPDCGLEGIVNLEYGAAAFLYQRTDDREAQGSFSGVWEKFLALAIITRKDDTPL